MLLSQARNIFVGRQLEMAELQASLNDALAGRGQVVMLAGEPGIGKTRTAQELANRAHSQGAHVLWGWCFEGEGAPPYWPWIQPIRSYVRETAPDRLETEMGPGAADIAGLLPEIHEKLPGLQPAPVLDPEQARFRLFDSLSTFLKNASASSPLLIVLEDLHWSDRSSLMLWEFISKEISTSRVMLLGTYRDIEVGRRHPLSQTLGALIREPNFRRVPLGGLSQQDVGRFVEQSAGVTLAASNLDLIHNRTEGNPLFLNELVRLLGEEGIEATETWATSLPEGVRDVIGQRLNRLSEQCNEVLTTASVIGREFDFQLLFGLSDEITEEQLLAVIDEAAGAHLIEGLPGRAEAYRFSHALIQQTLTDELTTSRKVRLHARIGQALEELYGSDVEAHAAELAHHFAEAVPVIGPEKLVRYSLLAGERALAAYAHEDALAHFEAGLAAMASQPVDAGKAALLFGLGRAQSVLQLDEAVSSLRMAFEYYMDLDDLEHVVAIAEYGDYGTRLGIAEIREMLNLALRAVRSDSHYAGRLLCRYGHVVGLREGDHEEARDAFEKALVIARREGDVGLEMNILSAAASVDGNHLQYESALMNSLNAIRLSDQVNDPRPLLNAHYFATSALMFKGDLEQARQHATAMLEPSERLRDRFWIEGTCWKNASVARLAGDWEEVRSICTGGLDVSIRRYPLLVELALAEHESGDSLQGDSYLQRLLELAQQGADFGYGNLVAPIVARITSSFDYLGVVESLAQSRIGSSTALPASKVIAEFSLAIIAILKDETIAAERHYRTFADRQGTMVNWTFSNDRLLGLLSQTMGNLDRATSHFEDALTFCRKAGYRPELAWTCCDYADTLLQRASTGSAQAGRGDRAKAMSLLEESLAISTELGMRPLMERATERLERTRSMRPREPAFPGGLTRREVEVLGLVAAGKTDREISKELVIGVRTVTTHVSNILNKIGAANRAEASSFATRNGLA